jgi:hypothetical protein
MAAVPLDARRAENISPLWRNETGAAYTEMLVCFMPMFTLITCLIQLALINVAHLIVQHSAVLAARAAVVVLPDNPACYPGNPPVGNLAAGATGNANSTPSLGSLGINSPPSGDFGALGGLNSAGSHGGNANDPRSVYRQKNARYDAIHFAAGLPLMSLAPSPTALFGRNTSIATAIEPGNVLSQLGFGLLYNRAALAVTFLKNGQYSALFSGREMVTARVTYAFNCGVPLARTIMCRDALALRYPRVAAIRDAVGRAIGSGSVSDILAAGAAIREAERGEGETDAATAELRTAPNNAGLLLTLATGQRFAIVRAEASMPNQGTANGNFPYRPQCGHRKIREQAESCR